MIIKWTIATPIIDRPLIFDVWIKSFNELMLPKKECKLLWLDMTSNDIVKNEFDKIKNDFGAYEYLDKSCKKYKTILNINLNSMSDRILSTAESFQILNNHRVGNVIFIEDDIIFDKDIFYNLEKIFFKMNEIKAVAAVQYDRRTRNSKALAWNWKRKKHMNLDWSLSKNHETDLFLEKKDGLSIVGATGMGFVLVKEDFLENYNFLEQQILNENHDGPDMIFGFNVSKVGFLVIDWAIKTIHLHVENGILYKIDHEMVLDFKNQNPYNEKSLA